MSTANPGNNAGAMRRFGDALTDNVVGGNDDVAAANKKAKTQHSRMLTFVCDASPARVQLLSHHTLTDLVRAAFRICDPRDGESADDHLWNIQVNGTSYEAKENTWDDHVSDPQPLASQTTLGQSLPRDPSGAIPSGVKLKLEYDYGDTSRHTIELIAVENPPQDVPSSAFPRRKPAAVGQALVQATFETPANTPRLDAVYSDLQEYAFGGGNAKVSQLNFFRAGRKNCFSFLQRYGRMVFLPEKPHSLSHCLKMLDHGASIPSDGGYGWQSVVVLKADTTKSRDSKWFDDLERGFCDCELVSKDPNPTPNWDLIFPKTAAFAGFRKDKTVPHKGWVRYDSKSGILQLVVGSGSEVPCRNAPKGTAFEGEGCHMPALDDTILFQVEERFDSIHALFCKVEGLLGTL